MENFEDLSSREQNVLEFIRAYILLNKYPPTFREIGRGIHISSTSTVHDYLTELKRRGFIEYTSGFPRTIRIIRSRKELFGDESSH